MKKAAIFISLIFTLLLSAQSFASSYYGPTIANDRLYRISLAVKPSAQVDVQQVMASIYKHNPYAFIDSNMNGLYAGVLLYIPTVDQIAQVDSLYAHNLIKQHNSLWQEIHKKIAPPKTSDIKLDSKEQAPENNNFSQSKPIEKEVFVEKEEVAAEKENTIFTSLDNDKVDVVNEVTQELVSRVDVQSSDLQKMQQQLAVMQMQLGQLLTKLKEQQPEQDFRSSLQSKYTLFDSKKFSDVSNSDYYSAFSIDEETAYLEWIIAALIAFTTLGLIVATQRDNYVDVGVDLDAMEDDEYDYIGSSDGIPVKLNLARAYCEMGNTEKAKKTLSEVIARGNKTQQEEAKEMLAEIEKQK